MKKIKTIEKNNIWVLYTIAKCHQAIRVKHVFKTKKNAKEDMERYKAKLVLRGYKSKHRVDY